MTKLLKHLGKYKPLNVLKINLQIGFEKATNCLSFKLLENSIIINNNIPLRPNCKNGRMYLACTFCAIFQLSCG